MGNILDLNHTLFKTLEGLENGTIDAKKAHAIVSVGNSIMNNAKLILQVAKESKKGNIANLIIGEEKAKELSYKDVYEAKTDYALQLGYNNLAEAIGDLGSINFEQKFKNKQND